MSNYKPHEQRVVNEATELNTKLSALRAFFTNETFDALNPEDQALLMMQEMAMQNYLSILHRRIENFEHE